MNYNYDDYNNNENEDMRHEHIPPRDETPQCVPKQQPPIAEVTAGQDTHTEQNTPTMDSPAPQPTVVNTPDTHRTTDSHYAPAESYTAPPVSQWSEPSYSETHETTTNMFSPGFCQNHGNQRVRPEPAHQDITDYSDRKRPRRGGFLRAVCLILACVLVSGAASYGVLEFRVRRGDFKPVNQVIIGGNSDSGTPAPSPIVSSGEQMTAEDIYDMACNQVVGIKTEVSYSGGFFSQPTTSTAVTGSGFIISGEGYILTNYHVIETAYENALPLKVFLSDGAIYDAEVIGYEASNDIALIKIEADGLKAAAIANSDNIRVGERVYAVGNPFGELVYTMTEGIISALDRVVTVDNKSINTFQLSAAVNSGNSGGPVYNSNGEVVGIVTAKFMSSSVEGIGFAIPINDAVEFATELIANGYITGRAYMGITVETVTSTLAQFFNWVEGAYVKTVQEGSAADRAGLKVGDVITKLGDNDVTSADSLVYAKKMFKAGDTTTITAVRGGETVELTITFDEDMSAGQAQQRQEAQQEPQQGQGRSYQPPSNSILPPATVDPD